MDFSKIKNFAKKQVKARFGNIFFITLLITICMAAVSSTYVGVVLTPAFVLSLVHVYVANLAGRDVEIKEAFSGFDDLWSAIKVNFFQGLFTMLWSILFVIPGIIKACAYSQAMYILGANKGKPALECLRESEELMRGHKWEYFVLQLSFIGWWLVVVLTFGLAAIWVVPYYYATMATFYIDILPSHDDDTESAASHQPSHTSSDAPHKPITFGNKGGAASGDADKGTGNRL